MAKSRAEPKMSTLPTEVLELMLQPLSFPDLVVCQKVCKRFRDVIRKSTPLQSTLACETITTETLHHISGTFGATRIETISRKLCPLLSEAEGQRMIGILKDSEAVQFAAAQYLSEPSTWAPLYLTNPPTDEAYLHLEFNFRSGRNKIELARTVRIHSSGNGGLTLGRLVDLTILDKTPPKRPRPSSDWQIVELRTQVDWPDGQGNLTKALGCGLSEFADWPSMAEQIERVEAVLGRKVEVGECWVQFGRTAVRQ